MSSARSVGQGESLAGISKVMRVAGSKHAIPVMCRNLPRSARPFTTVWLLIVESLCAPAINGFWSVGCVLLWPRQSAKVRYLHSILLKNADVARSHDRKQ